METLDSIIVSQYDWILGQAYRYVSNRMDAEDLAGEAILKMLSNREHFDRKRPFRPWCSVIILNTFITVYNRGMVVRFVSSERAGLFVSGYEASAGILLDEIHRAVSKCRKSSKSVDCVIMYSEGYSYEEIADAIGIPVGTVRSRISFGRNMIRNELEINR
jgi:RNA polymerase sigma-70 factor (ECF subfamily)